LSSAVGHRGRVAHSGSASNRRCGGCRELDTELATAADATEVLVLPTAAAFERPDDVAARAVEYFAGLGLTARSIMVLHRTEAEDPAIAASVEAARFVFLSDGSPLHLRSVLKSSALFDALLTAYRSGASLAASGAGATVLCDPMVDPRGGAYTVGLGVVSGLAVFPSHRSVADHRWARSIDLLPANATLAGIDAETALVRDRAGDWRVSGAGTVTLCSRGEERTYAAGGPVAGLPT
jgi:cyanophycinase